MMLHTEYPYMKGGVDMSTCDRIKAYMADKGHSVAWLSRKTGIPYKTLHSTLQAREPRADTYALICTAFEKDFTFFLKETG